MNSLATVSVFVGILLIMVRGPLLFAPEATLQTYRKLIADETRIRIIGVFAAMLGVAMISSAWGADQPAAIIISILGWIVALVAPLLLMLPAFYQYLADSFLDMSTAAARVIGVLSVAVGGFFIYLGLRVF